MSKIRGVITIGVATTLLATASFASALTVKDITPKDMPSNGSDSCQEFSFDIMANDVTQVLYQDGICVIGTSQEQFDMLARSLNSDKVGQDFALYFGDTTYAVFVDRGQRHLWQVAGGFIAGIAASRVANDISARDEVDHRRNVEAEAQRRVNLGISSEDELRHARNDRINAENQCKSCFRTNLEENGRRTDRYTGGKIIDRYELGVN